MTRSGLGALRLALAFALAAASATASATGGDAPESPLAIDPATFTALPAARSSMRLTRRTYRPPGPRIVLLSPVQDAVYRAGEPLALHAELRPAADGAAPDMETLAVRVLRGPVGTDLTERVRPYLHGTSLRVPAVDFLGHVGEFRFELDVLDERGRLGEAELRVTFKVQFRDALPREGATQGGQ